MLVACWSAKGGAGTTVVSVALAVLLARRSPAGALLVDLAGDAPVVLATAVDRTAPGVVQWLDAGHDVPADGLARLEVPTGVGLSLVPRGSGPMPSGPAVDALIDLLVGDPRAVVVDCGVLGHDGTGCAGDAGIAVAAAATQSLLVTRPCIVALHRAVQAPLHPSAVVLVDEAQRAIGRADIEAVVGAPVVAEVRVDSAVARAVDAGLLAARLPGSLERGLRRAA
jgi:hypothetical protein